MKEDVFQLLAKFEEPTSVEAWAAAHSSPTGHSVDTLRKLGESMARAGILFDTARGDEQAWYREQLGAQLVGGITA